MHAGHASQEPPYLSQGSQVERFNENSIQTLWAKKPYVKSMHKSHSISSLKASSKLSVKQSSTKLPTVEMVRPLNQITTLREGNY